MEKLQAEGFLEDSTHYESHMALVTKDEENFKFSDLLLLSDQSLFDDTEHEGGEAILENVDA